MVLVSWEDQFLTSFCCLRFLLKFVKNEKNRFFDFSWGAQVKAPLLKDLVKEFRRAWKKWKINFSRQKSIFKVWECSYKCGKVFKVIWDGFGRSRRNFEDFTKILNFSSKVPTNYGFVFLFRVYAIIKEKYSK